MTSRGGPRTAALLLAVVMAVLGFALDGFLIRVAAVTLIAASTMFVCGGRLVWDRDTAPVWLAVGVAMLFGLTFNLPKVGLPLVFQVATVFVALAFGIALAWAAPAAVHRAALVPLVLYQGILIIQVARGQFSVVHGVVLPGVGASTNLVSGILLYLQLLHAAAAFADRKRAPLWLPLISMLLSLPLKGRSGILLLTALFLCCLFQRWTVRQGSGKFGVAALWLSLAAGLAFWFRAPILAVFETTRLVYGFGDESRSMMRQQYLQGLSPLEVVTGGTYDPSPIILTLLENPHNSFIRAHYLFGLPFVILIAMLLTAAVLRATSAPRERWFLLGLLALFAVRALVDEMSFPGLLDFVFFFLLFRVTTAREPIPTARTS
jgi:hypothetical protein